MNLYLLKRIGAPDYDEHAGFVVRAASPRAARELVTNRGFQMSGISGAGQSEIAEEIWVDETKSACITIAFGVTGGVPGDDADILMRDFRAG